MSTPPQPRSIKIGADERGGWSSDRRRRDGAPPRPANLSVRCRVLKPTDQLRYSPGSLLMIVSPLAQERDRFAQRLIDNRAAVMSLEKVRALLAGHGASEEGGERAGELLDATVAKRLEAGETVVLTMHGLDAEERERYVRMAARFRRPCHLILVEPGREAEPEDDRSALNELRRRLDAGELGAEGCGTALRLGGSSVGELKSIAFRSAPRDD